MPKLNKDDALALMVMIIQSEEFPRLEKPASSDYWRKRYGLTERQQAVVEVRLEKIFSYLIGRK